MRHTSVRISQTYSYGQTDLPVAETFSDEARQTARLLAPYRIDKAYTSPLQRARRLADYCGFPDAQVDDRLKEMFMGDYEMVSFSRITPADLDVWYSDYMNVSMPGGETMHDVLSRMQSFFEELRPKPYHDVAVFFHGCAILCTLIWLKKVPPTANLDDIPPYGSVTTIEL